MSLETEIAAGFTEVSNAVKQLRTDMNATKVETTSPNLQIDYGTVLPAAGQEGRFFFLIPS